MSAEPIARQANKPESKAGASGDHCESGLSTCTFYVGEWKGYSIHQVFPWVNAPAEQEQGESCAFRCIKGVAKI